MLLRVMDRLNGSLSKQRFLSFGKSDPFVDKYADYKQTLYVHDINTLKKMRYDGH